MLNRATPPERSLARPNGFFYLLPATTSQIWQFHRLLDIHFYRWYASSVSYSEASEFSCSLQPSDIQVDHFCTWRTNPAESQQFFDLGLFSLSHCFDTAISEISNPARDSQVSCPLSHSLSEQYSLHPSADHDVGSSLQVLQYSFFSRLSSSIVSACSNRDQVDYPS